LHRRSGGSRNQAASPARNSASLPSRLRFRVAAPSVCVAASRSSAKHSIDLESATPALRCNSERCGSISVGTAQSQHDPAFDRANSFHAQRSAAAAPHSCSRGWSMRAAGRQPMVSVSVKDCSQGCSAARSDSLRDKTAHSRQHEHGDVQDQHARAWPVASARRDIRQAERSGRNETGDPTRDPPSGESVGRHGLGGEAEKSRKLCAVRIASEEDQK